MARPKLGEGDTERLHMMITDAELDSISEWQHANGIASKSEAIRILLQAGMRAAPFAVGVKRRTNRVPIMLSDDELSAIDDWRFMNSVATRSEAIRQLAELALSQEARNAA